MTRPVGSLAGLYVFAALLLAFETVSCGNAANPNADRVLQSIAVTPLSADALNFPNGQVQFTATGTFTKAPSPAAVPFTAPYSGGWSVSDASGIDQSIATINQDGIAQCKPGASGTFKVTAMASNGACHGTQCTSVAVAGNATLICP
jgi:hypothetical protein